MKGTYASLLTGLLALGTAEGAIVVDANLFQSSNFFGSSGVAYYAYFNVLVDDLDVVSVNIASSNQGLTGSEAGANTSIYGSFEALLEEVHAGPWTMTVLRNEGGDEPVLRNYTFDVDMSGLTASDPFFVINPINGMTGVPTGLTPFHWTPVVGSEFHTQGLSLGTAWDSRDTYASESLDLGVTSWTPEEPGLLPSQKYHFFVQHSQDVTFNEGVSISNPVTVESEALPNFSYMVKIHTEATSQFTTVPEPQTWGLLSALGLGAVSVVRRWRTR